MIQLCSNSTIVVVTTTAALEARVQIAVGAFRRRASPPPLTSSLTHKDFFGVMPPLVSGSQKASGQIGFVEFEQEEKRVLCSSFRLDTIFRFASQCSEQS